MMTDAEGHHWKIHYKIKQKRIMDFPETSKKEYSLLWQRTSKIPARNNGRWRETNNTAKRHKDEGFTGMLWISKTP